MTSREVRVARRVCYSCPVRRDCLITSLLQQEPWGVWGGLHAPERLRALAILGSVAAVLAHYDAGALDDLAVVRRR